MSAPVLLTVIDPNGQAVLAVQSSATDLATWNYTRAKAIHDLTEPSTSSPANLHYWLVNANGPPIFAAANSTNGTTGSATVTTISGGVHFVGITE